MPRTIRMLTLVGVVSAAVALPTASASASTTVSPTTLDFGSVPIGQQATLPVTLTQTCTSLTCILPPLLPDSFSPVLGTTPGFSLADNCPTTLLGMLGLPQSCTIDVSFIPIVGGTLNGLLNTGSGGPTVVLKGNGAVASAPAATGGVKKKKCKKKKHRAVSSAKKKCKKSRKK